MTNVTELDHWRKRILTVDVTHPVSRDEIKEAFSSRKPFVIMAMQLYGQLLQLHHLQYSIKKLDAEMEEISDLDLYLSTELSETTDFRARYQISFDWQSDRNLQRMREYAGTTCDDELFSKVVFAAWDAHKHMQQNGFLLIGKPGEQPQVVSAEDFYAYDEE